MGDKRISGPRLIALVGPFQSGKTTLLESILARSGALSRQGTVKDGSSVGDSSAEAIVSALLAGPQADGLSPLLPDGFQVLTVRVESGTCYLNLPAGITSLLPADAAAQSLMIQGLVDSLCSLEDVTQVQLMLDGEYVLMLGTVPISRPILPTNSTQTTP